MDKFVPYEKLSKKKKRELDLKKRKTWPVNPVTRKPQNPKAYNRKKTRRIDQDDYPCALFIACRVRRCLRYTEERSIL